MRHRHSAAHHVLLASWFGLSALVGPAAAEIIDRVVAVVGIQAITQSEVEGRMRLQALSDGTPVEGSPGARRETLERLIDLSLIRQEMMGSGFLEVNERELSGHLEALKRGPFVNGLSFERALESYGLTEEEVRAHLRRQLRFLSFVGSRFKASVVIPRPEVEAYYKEVYVPRHRENQATPPLPLEDVNDQIEAILVEERVDPLLEDWLRQRRLSTRVVILDPSFGLGDNEGQKQQGLAGASPLIPRAALERNAQSAETARPQVPTPERQGVP